MIFREAESYGNVIFLGKIDFCKIKLLLDALQARIYIHVFLDTSCILIVSAESDRVSQLISGIMTVNTLLATARSRSTKHFINRL